MRVVLVHLFCFHPLHWAKLRDNFRKSKITVPFKAWQVKADSIRKLNRVGKDHVPDTVPVPAQPGEAPF
jgi:hypothetical protein